MTRRPDIPRHPRQREGLPVDAVRSLRMSDDLWQRLRRAASRDGLTASFVLATLTRDFVAGRLRPPEVTYGGGAVRSARIDEEAWTALQAGAERLGRTASSVLTGLAKEYVDGRIYVQIRIDTLQEEPGDDDPDLSKP